MCLFHNSDPIVLADDDCLHAYHPSPSVDGSSLPAVSSSPSLDDSIVSVALGNSFRVFPFSSGVIYLG